MNQVISTPRLDKIRADARHIVRALGFMQKGLAGTDLSPSAVHTVLELGYGKVRTATDLGKLLHLEKSTVSRLLKKLEQDGLITVRADPGDKRARLLALTDQGRQLHQQVEGFARRQLRTALDPLAASDTARVERGLALFATALAPQTAARPNITFRQGYQPGIIAAVTHLHASYYAQNYGFGMAFERKVASEMAAFMARIDRPQNAIFAAYQGDELLGSLSLDGEDLDAGTCHLRWFIVSPKAQGLQIGTRLMERALAFVDQTGFARTRLWTFQGLDAARHLYEKHGFTLTHAAPGSQWGTEVIEQEFERPRG